MKESSHVKAMSDKITVRVTVSGEVQGVGFRAFTLQNAVSAGVKGWVENKPSGDVHAVLSGDEESVRKVLGAMKQGPIMSSVDDMDMERTTYLAFDGFSIHR